MLGAFRLHRGVGPVIINMSRISVDLFFMSWIYGFLTLAWTFGLVHMKNNKYWIKKLDANITARAIIANNGINKCDFSRTCTVSIKMFGPGGLFMKGRNEGGREGYHSQAFQYLILMT